MHSAPQTIPAAEAMHHLPEASIGLAHMTCPDPGKKYFLTVDVHRTIALDWLVYVVVRMYAQICCT